jgi:CDP-paratose 2-epimerase
MRVVLTGGAGFIGSNLAAHHMARGDQVAVVDNFSRAGSRVNLAWLRSLGTLDAREADVRDFPAMLDAVRGADVVYHLAAQVAVTTSVIDPRSDFETNALGAFNVLEAVRLAAPGAVAVYSSTNKVYGGMEDEPVSLHDARYGYDALTGGVPESRALDFHSPYGCSKGSGDQYFLDYARIYGLRTIVLRQSCIYGQRQMGNEDQGWVAHFAIQALRGREISIYGDGRQVRDILHIDDLMACYDAAVRHAGVAPGEAFNIGGGPANTISLLELVEWLERRSGRQIPLSFHDWRPGDQRVYVSDITAAAERLGWEPALDVESGLQRLTGWLEQNLSVLP